MESPVAQQPVSALKPSIFKVLPDGTVLYRTWQDAALAHQQQNGQQHQTVVSQAQARLGQQYAGKDGTLEPATLAGLVEFQVTGLIVVMVVLAGLSLLCAALGRLLHRPDQPAATRAPLQPDAAREAGSHPGLTDQQLVVLLTAAASQVLEQPVRVEYFRQAAPGDPAWAAQGRSELVHSHRLK